MASPPFNMLQAYTPPLSLWELVEQHVPRFEQDEVKSMLGSHIVDQSLELHNEIEMLLDIWRDMRDEQREGEFMTGLPEPPNQRERLVQEINFFVENVKEKAKQKGINPDHIFKYHNNDVIDYASDLSRPGSSMGRSSRSSDGRETPMIVTSPDRFSRLHEMTDEVEAVNDKLNVSQFDNICTHLRSTMEKEVEQLVNDLEFLQGCLDNEADIRDSITTPRTSREPTLTELREERASLEKELLSSDNMTPLPDVQKSAFIALTKKSLPPTQPNASVQPSPPKARPAPMKANHSLYGKSDAHCGATTAGECSKVYPIGKESLLKASHNIVTKTSPKDFSSVQSDSDSMSEKMHPAPAPPKESRSDSSIHALPNNPRVLASSHPPKTASQERSPRDAVFKPRMSRQQKTPSPSRIRVVDLNSIVDIRAEKRENSSVENEGQFDFASPVSSNFSVPSSATNVPDQSLIGIRPSSADRFRKMVMGCRDGE